MRRALFLHEDGNGIRPRVETLDDARLSGGDVLVSVLYSGMNYKDALAVTGRGKVIRGEYPFIPGIDLVGRVEESASELYRVGDMVIATGWGLGETHWGGFSEVQRLQSAWLLPLPDGLSPEGAMIAGTAGFTAMLSVMALEEAGAEPSHGEFVVTGASGGVGSMAVALLAAGSYTVVASTGTTRSHNYLRSIGASRIIDRNVLSQGPKRPLDSARWAGAVDTVGGTTLAAIITQLDRHGSVAACGLVGGHELNTTVFPFILRGVNLLGIDSNTAPMERRRRAWSRLANTLSDDILQTIKADLIGLDEIPAYSEKILAGEIQGRLVIDVHR